MGGALGEIKGDPWPCLLLTQQKTMSLLLYRTYRDEATFDKRDVSRDPVFKHLVKNKNETYMWEQWGGMVQRRRPETMI